MSLWTDPGAGTPFGGLRKGRVHLDAVEQLKDWTRERFALSDDETVVISENECRLPGFPPMETLVAFWTADGTRHHFKVFKPAERVDLGDIPPAWMREALAAIPGIECSCCA